MDTLDIAQLERFKKLGRLFDVDKIITPDEMAQILESIVGVLADFKKETSTLNEETKNIVRNSLDDIQHALTVSINKIETKASEGKDTIQSESTNAEKILNSLVKTYKEAEVLYSQLVDFKVKDGKDGESGKDGNDGYTPVKGKDYFTDSEKKEFIDEVMQDINLPDIQAIKEELESIKTSVKAQTVMVGGRGIADAPRDGKTYGRQNRNWVEVTVGGTGTSDHSLLTNLTNDDHPQYHNNARGDARYYQKSEVFTKAETQAEISALVDTAPTTLNTLNELAAALGDDPNFATTITTQIGQKENSANKATTFTGNTTSNILFPTIKAVYDWATATFAALSHTHTAAQVTDFNTAVSANTDVAANTSARHTHSNKAILDAITASFTTAQESKLSGIQAGAEVNVNADWNAVSGDAQILNKPTTMPPSAHTHTIAEVTGLQTSLDGKAATSHTHSLDNLSDVTITSPTSGQVLKFNGAEWVNDTDAVSGGGGGVTDHGALTGLWDDDHTQYHTDARGDARYYTKSEVDTSLSGKVASNTAITGATKTKITYDAKGLVINGADATTADIADSTNKRYVTDAQLTVIGNTSGTNTGDETNITIKSKLGIATLSGSNTGDQTSIVGITGTTAQFNTALTDGDFATLAGTEALTNKEVVRRVSSVASTATLTPVYGSYDDYIVTALAANITIANPTGTPKEGQQFIIRLKDNGTARTITWGTAYRVIGVTSPITTVVNKTVYIGGKYNSTDAKVDIIAVAQEA